MTMSGCTRRKLLGTGALTAIGSVAGCTVRWGGNGSSGESDVDAVPEIPRVQNPPDAVYVPTHREAMRHLPIVEAGEYALSPMLTYPHSFWLVTGTEREEVIPDGGRDVHLMVTVWDAETGQVLPVDAGATMRVLKDDEIVDQRAPWPMISQTMGFHFGDNVPLSEDGTYTVEVDLNPIEVRKTGGFADRFEERATASFEFEYDDEFRQEVTDGVEYLDESDWGRRGAIAPPMGMDGHGDDDHDHGDHHMPFSALPEADTYPGTDLGGHESGDARFVIRYRSDSRFADGGYLLVFPRTPYNQVPLADMSLSVAGDVETDLVQTLDSELGLHYGAEVDLFGGQTFDLTVDGPPQVSRHAGYETAFLEMPSMRVEAPE